MEELSPEWNAACLRVEDYLRSHRVVSRAHLLRLTLETLEEAKLRRAQGESPVQAAMRLATARTETWFSQLAGDESLTDATSASRGRVAYFASGGDRLWAEDFLSTPPPAGLLDTIRATSIQAGPALEFRSLVRKEIDYGPMEDIARETWDQFSWGHVLRAFIIWVIIFFVAYGTWLRFFQ